MPRKERGVYRRSDSTQEQWQLKVPKDPRPLSPRYGTTNHGARVAQRQPLSVVRFVGAETNIILPTRVPQRPATPLPSARR